jgi:hypothetical protein
MGKDKAENDEQSQQMKVFHQNLFPLVPLCSLGYGASRQGYETWNLQGNLGH